MVYQLLWIALPAILAGFIQSVTGFGAGIVLMLFFPIVFSVLQSAALSQSIGLFLCILLLYRYRKSVNFKLILLPLLIYFPIYFAALTIAAHIRADFLKPILGIFLLCMAVYLFFFSGKFTIRAGVKSAFVCAVLSAVVDAFFGTGGPPMVVYFLATTKSKEEYLGTLQAYFTICAIYGVSVRILKGQITDSMIPLIACGMFVLMIGILLGSKIVNRINADMLKKIVYSFIGIVGVIIFITSFVAR
jgi:uncharacterized membrane protein YfcA